MKSRLRPIAVFVAVVIFTSLIPAHASFPGKNGRIVFIQDGEVFTMNSDGTDIKQLTQLSPDNSAAWAAWSADGKQIVFNEFSPPDGVAQVWAMNSDGTNQHLVFAEQEYSENRPSFSPDGIMAHDGAEAVRNSMSILSAKIRAANFDLASTYANDFLSRQ